jgi:hypothetical protein
MKKIYSILLISLLMASFSFGQSGIKVGVGGVVGLPMGTFGDLVGMGFGAAVVGEYKVADNIIGTFTTGYLMFSAKEDVWPYPDYSIIPLMVGGKYFFAENMYGTVQVGLNMVSYTIPAVDLGLFTFPEISESGTEFGYALGAGYEMGDIDLLVKYGSFMTDANYLGLTAVYKFSL